MNHSKKCKRIFQTNFAAEDMKFLIQLEKKDIYLRLLKRQTREYRGSRKNAHHNIREKWRQLTVSPTFSLTHSLRSQSVQRILGEIFSFLSIYLPTRPPTNLSLYLPAYPPNYRLTSLSTCLATYPPTYLSIYLPSQLVTH